MRHPALLVFAYGKRSALSSDGPNGFPGSSSGVARFSRMHSCGFCDWDRRALLGWAIRTELGGFSVRCMGRRDTRRSGWIASGSSHLLRHSAWSGFVERLGNSHQRKPRHCNVCVHGRVCSYRPDHTSCDDNGRSSNQIQVGLSASC